MIKYCSLSSSSQGNAYVLNNGEHTIMIDAGISFKKIKERLADINIEIENVMGVILTHSHRDHSSGAAMMSHKINTPLYCTETTYKELVYCVSKGKRKIKLDNSLHREIKSGECFEIAGFNVTPISVSHDTKDCHAYYIEYEGRAITIGTDLGHPTPELIDYISKSDHLILESNYSPLMLSLSSRTLELKERIASDHGHLSNMQCAEAITKGQKGRLKHVHLAHVSQECNTLEAAEKYVREHIPSGITLDVLPRTRPSSEFCIE